VAQGVDPEFKPYYCKKKKKKKQNGTAAMENSMEVLKILKIEQLYYSVSPLLHIY
jgi:hypothetical protein